MPERWRSLGRGADEGVVREIPIRARLVLDDGTAPRINLTVFCIAEQRSVDVDRCLRCSHNVEAGAARDGAIRCRPAIARNEYACTRAEFELQPIGTVMSTAVICVAATMTVARFRTHVAPLGAKLTPIVNGDDWLVGVVGERELERSRYVGARNTIALCVGDVMHVELHPIAEGATIGEALQRMASSRMRRLPVVDQRGGVVGVVDDVALLHGFAGLTPRWPGTEE